MGLYSVDSNERNHVFQLLKPPCVALSQAVQTFQGPNASTTLVAQRLEVVLQALKSVVGEFSFLDEKLADYAFFPLSHALKHSQSLSLRCLELSLQCLSILLERGWRDKIKPPLAMQIIILCTLMAEKEPKNLSVKESTEELQHAAFLCLYHVFIALDKNREGKAVLLSDAQVPQLGQTISTLLEGIEGGESSEVQNSAAMALQALCGICAQSEHVAAFFPGIVSKFTKVLTPQTKSRRNWKVIAACLATLTQVLEQIMGDEVENVKTPVVATGHAKFPASDDLGHAHLAVAGRDVRVADERWLETAATQLKSALSNIFRLRSHDRADVKEAVAKLCFVTLTTCSRRLSNCSSLAMSTLVSILATDETHVADGLALECAVREDVRLSDLLRETLYDWLQSLPRVVTGADEENKGRLLRSIGAAYELLKRSDVEVEVVEKMLLGALRDSLVVMLQESGKMAKSDTVQAVEPLQSLELMLGGGDGQNAEQAVSPLAISKGQEQTLTAIEDLVRRFAERETHSVLLDNVMRSLRQSQGDVQVVNFWLAYRSLQTKTRQKDPLSDLMYFDDSARAHQEDLEDLYSLALTILSDDGLDESSHPPDSRLQSLALRAVALRAELVGRDFRAELIDALYPVLHVVASPTHYSHQYELQLQREGISTLNKLASACGYIDVRDLIVDNVDYLTNAVALKLNAFDVSPQAPRVLLMMVRLAGPALLPYLDDTVESIFAALEDYHGYGLLVELLFRVLGVVAEEGAKADGFKSSGVLKSKELLEVGIENDGNPSIPGLRDLLRENKQDEEEARAEARRQDKRPKFHPTRPWSEVQTFDNEEKGDATDSQMKDDSPQQASEEEPSPPPLPKTYALLLKIASLTQHFLSQTSSPPLQNSLLTLIRTTVPVMAKHENSFLPLINSLWPEIAARINNDEDGVANDAVQAAALEAVSMLCQHAGNFMQSRIHQLWPIIKELYCKVTREILNASRPIAKTAPRHEAQNRTSNMSLMPKDPAALSRAFSKVHAGLLDHTNTSMRLLWEALVGMLIKIFEHVPLMPHMFDDVLEMLRPVLEAQRSEHDISIGSLLEIGINGNTDAVWLARKKMKVIDGSRGPDYAILERPLVPQGKAWHFAGLGK